MTTSGLWVAIEFTNKSILDIYLSAERNMFVAQNFIRNLVNKYGKHPVSTDGGIWYPYACKFLKLRRHLHSSFREKHHRENNSIHKRQNRKFR